MKTDPLSIKASLGVATTPIIFGLPLFLAAGTMNYWEAWVFLAVFTIVTALHTAYLLKADRALLERRMRAGPSAEKRPEQRLIMILMLAAYLLMLIISGLDKRFDWSVVPAPISLGGDFFVVISYLIFFEVFRENSFASATIELSEKQKLVFTGLYGIVRHPMYTGAAILTCAIPLALGSLWAGLLAIAVFPVLHWRIVDEEKFLLESLEGYRDYTSKVRYRLLPGLY